MEQADEFTQKIMTYGHQIMTQLVAGARQDNVEPGELLYSTIVAALNMTLSFTAGDRDKSLQMMEEAFRGVVDTAKGMDVIRGDGTLEKSSILHG